MTYEEIRPGQILEHNKVYSTEYLLVLNKNSKQVKCISEMNASLDLVRFDKDAWDGEVYHPLTDRVILRDKRQDFIVFMWDDTL